MRWFNEWHARHPYLAIVVSLAVLSVAMPAWIIAISHLVQRISSPPPNWEWLSTDDTCRLDAHAGIVLTVVCPDTHGTERRVIAALAGVKPVADPSRRQELDAFIEQWLRPVPPPADTSVRCRAYVGVPADGSAPPSFVRCTVGPQSLADLVLASGMTSAAGSSSPASVVLPPDDRRRLRSLDPAADTGAASIAQTESWLATLYGLLSALGAFLLGRAQAAAKRKGHWVEADLSLNRLIAIVTTSDRTDQNFVKTAEDELVRAESAIKSMQAEEYNPALIEILYTLDTVRTEVRNGSINTGTVNTLAGHARGIKRHYA